MILTPRDHAEAVALFRAEIIGALARRELDHGELARRAARAQPAALPAARRRRHAHASRPDAGALALRLPRAAASPPCGPTPRRDRGRARDAHRRAARSCCSTSAASTRARRCRSSCARSSPTAASTRARSRRRRCAGSSPSRASTACRCATARGAQTRLRWQAERPGALWHGDVCHGPALHHRRQDARRCASTRCSTTPRATSSRSRRTTPSARSTCSASSSRALRRHGAARRALPRQRLDLPRRRRCASRCARLGITLLHARPYDAAGARQDGALLAHAARGLPRLPRRARLARTTSTSGSAPSSTSTTTTRRTPACSGRTPGVGLRRPPRARRRPRRADAPRRAHRPRRAAASAATPPSPSTASTGELDQGFLAGRIVTVARCLVDARRAARGSSTRASASRCTPSTRSATPAQARRRAREPAAARRRVPFDPAGALLDQAAGRPPRRHATRRTVDERRPTSPLRLSEPPPFSKEIADADLWLPPSKQARRRRAARGRSTSARRVVLVGEPGVGKTCVLRALRHRLPEAGFRLTYCHNATLGRRDFYRQLCLALGLSPVGHRRRRLLRRLAPTSRSSAASASTPSSSSTRPTSCTRTRSTTCTSCSTTSGTAARCSRSSSSACPSCATASRCAATARSTRASTTASHVEPAHARRHRRVPPHPPRAAPAATASSSPPTPSPCSTRPPSARMRDIDRLATAALREAAAQEAQARRARRRRPRHRRRHPRARSPIAPPRTSITTAPEPGPVAVAIGIPHHHARPVDVRRRPVDGPPPSRCPSRRCGHPAIVSMPIDQPILVAISRAAS